MSRRRLREFQSVFKEGGQVGFVATGEPQAISVSGHGTMFHLVSLEAFGSHRHRATGRGRNHPSRMATEPSCDNRDVS
jgi:hypothetical protein